ncbi:MAG: hypothetical protein IJ094_12345 [Bacilli bacterium]|nr:hypothetical protein [Bacilli bacterium]
MSLDIGNNIIPSINYIMSSIPDDLTDLEKIRYIYINLGKIFNYDYRVIDDESIIEENIDYSKSKIKSYKTCYQISEILCILINGLLPNCSAKLVERTIPGRKFKHEHVAVEVELNNTMKILLDLTLDLSNIQGNLKTKEFGYTTNENGDYDIISQSECKIMDEKLGFINDKYTDDYIEEFNEELKKLNYGDMTESDKIEYKIKRAKERFSVNFNGKHEAIRYIYTILSKILTSDELSCLKQYNLIYSNSEDNDLIAIYLFDKYGLYYCYSSMLGFNKIKPSVIETLLKSGWKTNSKSINKIFADDSLGKRM